MNANLFGDVRVLVSQNRTSREAHAPAHVLKWDVLRCGGTQLERHNGLQPDNRLIADRLAVGQIWNAAGWMEEVLKVRLHLPPRGDLVQVGRLEDGFACRY